MMNMKMYSSMILAASFAMTGCHTPVQYREAVDMPPYRRSQPADAEIAELFERWNQSLQTGEPARVVANYAPESILLPTVSNQPRFTLEEKVDYFEHFLQLQPSGVINLRQIQVDGDMAVDSGIYTFTFGTTGEQVRARYSYTYRRIGGEWLIVSHHSSAMPE